ncbi:MAG: hypothetical protein IPJ08_15180 [Burkholderiales bacterium]|jgi:hypothetical protein|nr:hypothetical protein [Burkholderiales bacterium]
MNMNVTTNGSVFGSAPAVTQHAWARMCGRRLNGQTIDAVLSYGRVIHVRGAAIYAIGRKEVERLGRSGVDVAEYEGVQVVCTPDSSAILTVYRNSDFRGLKPRSGRRWH